MSRDVDVDCFKKSKTLQWSQQSCAVAECHMKLDMVISTSFALLKLHHVKNVANMIINSFLHFVTILIIIVFSLNQIFCSAQGNDCEPRGRCGAFGICDSLNSPICSCLQGFDPANLSEWSSGNWSSGCVRRVPLACTVNNGTGQGTAEDKFLELKDCKYSGYTDWLSVSRIECENHCLKNCSCTAYDYTIDDRCLLWLRNLLDVQKSQVTAGGSHLNIRLASSEIKQKNDNKKLRMRTIIGIVIALGIVVCICGYLCWKMLNKQKGNRKDATTSTLNPVDASIQDALNRVNLLEFPLFKLEVLASATKNFSEYNKLGKGGFGPVYKGVLPNGREIAVKRLSNVSKQGLQEFMNEVELISKLQHKNLVRLLGCCIENNEKMLIYEYLPNKSLDVFLFDSCEVMLDWRKRFHIIEGICRGILYLHRDSRLKIIHRDLKPSNILLDNDWNPKISDFGMAKIYGSNQDHVVTARVVGTFGYMAPEYAMEGKFSEKSDVFSFGVMVIEIATGKRNTSFFPDGDSLVNLLGHVWKQWKEDNVAMLIDSRISDSCNRKEVLRCMHIGLLCVQQLPKDRPSISVVQAMLRCDILELQTPNRPASSAKLLRNGTIVGSSSSQQGSTVNGVTLTNIDGR